MTTSVYLLRRGMSWVSYLPLMVAAVISGVAVAFAVGSTGESETNPPPAIVAQQEEQPAVTESDGVAVVEDQGTEAEEEPKTVVSQGPTDGASVGNAQVPSVSDRLDQIRTDLLEDLLPVLASR
jgi:hypothetical protein